jgi:uncharacterized membrane protein YagU involved in acid resistance
MGTMFRARLSPARAILVGTLVVGTIDALDAVVFFGVRSGTPPARIFQSIASGLLGRAAYQRGLPAVALGVLIHYVVAFGIVATYVAASRVLPLLTRRPIVCGILYGIGAYFFMNLVVIPLSAIGPQRFTTGPFLNGILIHALGIGIPTGWIAARTANKTW